MMKRESRQHGAAFDQIDAALTPTAVTYFEPHPQLPGRCFLAWLKVRVAVCSSLSRDRRLLRKACQGSDDFFPTTLFQEEVSPLSGRESVVDQFGGTVKW